MVSMKIKIPSLPENLRVVESFIDNIKEEYCLTDDIYGNIMITVIEAVNNAIIHGNKKDENKEREKSDAQPCKLKVEPAVDDPSLSASALCQECGSK